MNYLDLLKYKIILRKCYKISFTPFSSLTDFIINKIGETKTNQEKKYEIKLWEQLRKESIK